MTIFRDENGPFMADLIATMFLNFSGKTERLPVVDPPFSLNTTSGLNPGPTPSGWHRRFSRSRGLVK